MAPNLDTVSRNTVEVEKWEEVEQLLEQEEGPRAYVGYETSGPVHLGHLTSVQKLLDVEQAGFEPVVLWADLHTELNEKGKAEWDEEERREWIEDMTTYWQSTFEAIGLDAEFVKGTDFQRSEEYWEDYLRLSVETNMNTATSAIGDIAGERGTFTQEEILQGIDEIISEIDYSQIDSEEDMREHVKEKAVETFPSGEPLSVAQNAVYPLMQALDIPYLDVDLAMGGIDQRGIHMRLGRDKLPEIGYDKPSVLHYPLLTSLKGDGTKMSSSKPETMFPLHAPEETIKNRIEGAYFDPDVIGEYPEGLNENPVMQIAERFIFGNDQILEVERKDKFGGDVMYETFSELYEDIGMGEGEMHPKDVKKAVGEVVAERLEPVRDYFKDNPEELKPLTRIGHEMPDYIDEY